MIAKIIEYLNGRKVYACTGFWFVYRIAVSKGWIQPIPDLEAVLLAGGAVAFRSAISKSGPTDTLKP